MIKKRTKDKMLQNGNLQFETEHILFRLLFWPTQELMY